MVIRSVWLAVEHAAQTILRIITAGHCAIGFIRISTCRLILTAELYDHTPAPGTGREGAKNNRHRKTGGGQRSRQLLERHIAPQVEQANNHQPRTARVWGHSYGGLFTFDLAVVILLSYFHYSAPARHSAGDNLPC
ncbi:hypothetical protein KCP70_05040 [Salmonella enterica subsp. enterica]|nr:hypothetical protein KCP70_05040 [Salmonella enterica subsp. enterica]